YDNIVVVFVAAEKDDDISVAKKAMKEVKESLDVIKCNEVLIYPFAHLSSDLAKPSDALKVIKEMETEAKKLGLKTHRSPFGWNKQYSFKIKGHPMAEQGKTITSKDVKKEEEELVSKALKEEEKIVSHWHIMDIDGKLIPIKVDKGKVVGDFDFKKYPNLEKFALYELAKNREVTIAPPHIKMMREMEIADYEDASDSGNLRFYPKGRLIKSLLEEFVTKTVIDYGGMEVETPLMYSVDHPAAVAYLNKFPARQYIIKSGDREFFGRFSACFGQFCMADDMTISHKDLPVWLYELTRYSFRRERKSELAGLRRLRAFTMPDVHAFCKDIPQAIQEFQKRFKMSQETLDGIGFKKGEYELAVRFTKDFYKEHKDFIELLLRLHGKPALIEIWDKKVFYFVLKYEFNIVDALGKCSALSTDQIDIENSKNYGIRYIDENNKKKEVIILHCSPSGAIERDIYALLERAYLTEKSGGISQLPLWLSPTQIRLIPLSDDFVDFSKEVMQKLEKENIRVDVDDRQLTVQKRIRDAELEWVPFILVLGSREKDSGQFNIRIRSEKSKEVKMKLEELVKKIKDEVGDKPFKKLSLPKILSKRPIFVG
ncbi:MAG: threonine--tRNA ligase, partial [Candidatus Aenigmarchaeota archaeon CG01_land_8_20_14_3_00_37_9]